MCSIETRPRIAGAAAKSDSNAKLCQLVGEWLSELVVEH